MEARIVPGRPKFAGDTGFHAELKRRVDEYFRKTGLSPRDNARMYLKTAALLAWLGASYALLVFAAATWWEGLLLSCSLALAIAGIGFGIQHDANHGSYSKRDWVNRLMGMTLDLLGASSYVWRFKHNVFHHTYTNIDGVDADIALGPWSRLSPAQPRRRFHRFQQFYLWGFYGLLLPKWHFVDDFKDVAQGRIAANRFPRPRGRSLVELAGGKALFFAWALGLPLALHRFWVVLAFFFATSFAVGVILAIVFQLAHCVEEAAFPDLSPGAVRIDDAWAVHQVRTTVDFAPTSGLLTWYLGGLNFQIEHHLFPRICHVHYPRISAAVRGVCDDFGVPYSVHDGVLGALASHWRWLRRMGRPTGAEAGAA